MIEFLSGIVEFITSLATFDYAKIQEIFNLAALHPNGSNLTDGVSFPAASLWETAQNVSLKAVAPVAVTVCGIFFAMELFHLLSRNQTSGIDMFYSIIMTLLKMAICVVVVKNMTGIISLCFSLSTEVANNIGKMITIEEMSSINTEELVTEAMKDADLMNKFFAGVTAWFCNVVINIALTFASIVCQLRFIEIYIFVAVAPVPFCTFCSSEYKSIGVSFLKRLLALGLQGAFIMIAVYFFMTIIGAIQLESVGDIFTLCWTYVGFSLLLVIAIFQTGGWAKSLLQVN